jgi:hypothetical protein
MYSNDENDIDNSNFKIDIESVEKIILNDTQKDNLIEDNNENIDNNVKTIDEVPEYMKQKNLTEYVTCRNHRECILNLFKIHRESVNAWTMVIQLLGVLIVSFYIIFKFKTNIVFSSILILHCIAYICHFPFSFGYHTFFTLDIKEHIKWRRYDVYGIFVRCIILSFTLSFFTYNDIKYTILNTLLTLIIVIKSIKQFEEQSTDDKPLDRYKHGKLIGLAVLSFNIPVLYTLYNCVKNKNYDFSFKISLLIILTIFIFGGSYVFQFPDVFFEPGVFNKIGNHHNMMHIGVIILGVLEILYIFSKAKNNNYIKTLSRNNQKQLI